MTKEELQKRIDKKNQEIEKINKRILKWSNGLRPEDIAACEPFGNCYYGDIPRSMNWRDFHGTPEYQEAYRNYKNYVDTHKDIPSSEDWNKGPNIGELYSAYRDLGEAKHTLSKYQDALASLNKFDSEEKIEVIWNFLQNWKQRASDYYHKNAELYSKLRNEYSTKWNKYKESVEYEDEFNRLKSHNLSNWRIEYELENRFEKEYYEDIDAFTKQIAHRDGTVDEDKLEKSLDKEIRKKYERLVDEVTEKAGEIVDASNLSIDAKGEISGLIKGTKNTVELWATISGGYNVQCAHIRSYIRIRN